LLMLLPGFLAVGLAQYIGELGELSEFELTLSSLALSLVVFVIAILTYRCFCSLRRLAGTKSTAAAGAVIPRPTVGFVSTVLLTSLIVGILFARAYETDFLLTTLRWLPGSQSITKRSSSRPLVFLLSLNRKARLEEGRPKRLRDKQAWLEVVLEGGERFAGYPNFFATGKERSEVFLSPACTVDGETVVAIEGPGVLVPEDKIAFSIFYDRTKSKCKEAWDKRVR